MSNLLLHVICTFVSFFIVLSNCIIEPDYYWRVYNGTVPEDAVGGGRSAGRITYIGLITIPRLNGLLPANIYPNKKAASAAVDGRSFKDDKFVLILCSPYKEKLKWTSASTTDMPQDNVAVLAGIEKDGSYNVYIGRAWYKNDLIIGKVFRGDCRTCGIWFPNYNGGEEHYRSFEVLTYQPEGHSEKLVFSFDN